MCAAQVEPDCMFHRELNFVLLSVVKRNRTPFSCPLDDTRIGKIVQMTERGQGQKGLASTHHHPALIYHCPEKLTNEQGEHRRTEASLPGPGLTHASCAAPSAVGRQLRGSRKSLWQCPRQPLLLSLSDGATPLLALFSPLCPCLCPCHLSF